MPNADRQTRMSQSGNIFFYILLGVALFAALSFAVSRSGNAGKDISDEKANLLASELINYSKQVQEGVTKLRLRGCKNTEISFENSTITGYANPDSPSSGDKHCWIFDAAGGNLSLTSPPPGSSNSASNWFFTPSYYVFYYGRSPTDTTCDTTSNICGELTMMLFDVPEKLCRQVNILSGLQTSSQALPTKGGTDGVRKFTGSWTASLAGIGSGAFSGSYNKVQTFCYNANTLNNLTDTVTYSSKFHIISIVLIN